MAQILHATLNSIAPIWESPGNSASRAFGIILEPTPKSMPWRCADGEVDIGESMKAAMVAATFS